ncbi:TolC family protein [Leptospira langatensis]|uniref:TolC family protein n=1 Tax=Leptospira langatensis TaxID=2484983 RepID=A0A5F1ZN64_9LEPT|nr:TolC family protein [Leptospira langatensis]TGK05212.1 TolC family protein [Leptospira langatensis]TGL38347.1 TolC family protein [Leptospira langatensis]
MYACNIIHRNQYILFFFLPIFAFKGSLGAELLENDPKSNIIITESEPNALQNKGRSITLQDAERMFLRNNLSLLSSRLEVESKKAAIIQAGLWENPSVYVDQNIYNQQTKQYFDVTKNGETMIQVQQLFYMAGKRDKRVQLAKWNKGVAEQMFYDTLRSLKLELRSSFFQLHYSRNALEFYEESIPRVKNTIRGAENVYKNRQILLSELLRLKSILFRLETDRSELIKNILEREKVLKILLNETDLLDVEIFPVLPGMDDAIFSPLVLEPERLLNVALEHRPDLKGLELIVNAERANLSLQKAMAVPDLTLGGSYDRAGNYIKDYYGVTVSVPIPVFNRNQGNIRASETALASKKAELEEKLLSVRSEVRSAMGIAKEKDRLLQEYKEAFTKDYKNLSVLMIENYKKKYLTILEFADFFESYSESTLKMIRLQSDRIEAVEVLNFTVGKTIFGEL